MQGWFQTNINIGVFGKNIADRAVETEVVGRVGSYGKQINTIIDAMLVVIEHLEKQKTLGDLSQRDHYLIYKFKELADLADTAAAEIQGEVPESTRRRLSSEEKG